MTTDPTPGTPGTPTPGSVPITLPIDDVILLYLEGRADEATVAQLNAALQSDPAVRRRFVALSLHARCLAELTTAEAQSDKPDAERPSGGRSVGISNDPRPLSAAGAPICRKGYEPKSKSPITNRQWAIFSAVAAALLAACGIAVYVYSSSLPHSPIPDPTPPPPVATLIQNTGKLTTPHDYPAEGDDYSAGEYALASGTAEFMLTNSVNVKLRGESRMVMHNDMNVALTRGSAEFICPKDAKGFTVHLPDRSRIVDLGTAFRIEIGEHDHATLRVTDGLVRWHSSHVSAETVVVNAGQSARVVDGRLVIVDPLLIAHWKLDETTGSVATDSSGHGRHARLGTSVSDDNAQPTIDQPGRFGRAMAFVSNDRDLIDASAHIHDIVSLERGTLSFWFKTSTSARQGIFRIGADHRRSNNRFAVEIGDYTSGTLIPGTLRVVLRNKNQNLLEFTTTSDLNDGVWHLVTLTQDGEQARLYIDGEDITESSERANGGAWFADIADPSEFWIGRDAFPGSSDVGTLDGVIDDVALFDEPLAPSQIVKLHQRGAENESPPNSESETADR